MIVQSAEKIKAALAALATASVPLLTEGDANTCALEGGIRPRVRHSHLTEPLCHHSAVNGEKHVVHQRYSTHPEVEV